VERWRRFVRIDGSSIHGQPALLVTVDRALQATTAHAPLVCCWPDAAARHSRLSFTAARRRTSCSATRRPWCTPSTGCSSGRAPHHRPAPSHPQATPFPVWQVRREVFVAGGPETILTVVHVDRTVGFRLAWSAMPIRAVQQLVAALQDLYPNYTQRILIVNLPGYLMWFVRFVKGMLCEVTANKLELVADEAALLRFFTPEGLPSIYRATRSAAVPEPPSSPEAANVHRPAS